MDTKVARLMAASPDEIAAIRTTSRGQAACTIRVLGGVRGKCDWKGYR